MKVVINGFGRIGRTVLRAWLQGGWPGVQIVAINDIADAETCAYLFEYDSVFGRMAQPVSVADGQLRVGDTCLRLTHKADLSELDLSGVDLVMECTGRADRTEVCAARHFAPVRGGC